MLHFVIKAWHGESGLLSLEWRYTTPVRSDNDDHTELLLVWISLVLGYLINVQNSHCLFVDILIITINDSRWLFLGECVHRGAGIKRLAKHHSMKLLHLTRTQANYFERIDWTLSSDSRVSGGSIMLIFWLINMNNIFSDDWYQNRAHHTHYTHSLTHSLTDPDSVIDEADQLTNDALCCECSGTLLSPPEIVHHIDVRGWCRKDWEWYDMTHSFTLSFLNWLTPLHTLSPHHHFRLSWRSNIPFILISTSCFLLIREYYFDLQLMLVQHSDN